MPSKHSVAGSTPAWRTKSSNPDGKSAEAQRVAKTGGLLTHQHATKLARQGFILFTHMSGRFAGADRESGITRFGGFFLACNLSTMW